MKMKFNSMRLSVSTLVLTAAISIPAMAASDPVYNPATVVAVSGVVTNVREVPAGQPLDGVHVAVKTRDGVVDVYLGPKQFMKFLKADVEAGDEIRVMGSRVKSTSGDVILAREVSDGRETIELRDLYGMAAWKTWGVEADPTSIH
jgi:hypothetical protein